MTAGMVSGTATNSVVVKITTATDYLIKLVSMSIHNSSDGTETVVVSVGPTDDLSEIYVQSLNDNYNMHNDGTDGRIADRFPIYLPEGYSIAIRGNDCEYMICYEKYSHI